jgi:hypothetical protein
MTLHPEVLDCWQQIQHKMFQPLASVRCGLELRAMTAKGEQQMELESMLTQLDRTAELAHFAEDLLLDTQERRTVINLQETLKTTIRLLAPLAEQRGIKLCLESSDAEILCGRNSATAAISDLAEYAVAQCAPGESLFVSVQSDNCTARLRIDGMMLLSEKQAAHAFELFAVALRGIYPELWNKALVRAKNLFRAADGTLVLERSQAGWLLEGKIPAHSRRLAEASHG